MSSDEEEDVEQQPPRVENPTQTVGFSQLSQQENIGSNPFNLTLIPPPHQNPLIPYPRVEAPMPQNLFRQYYPFNDIRGMSQLPPSGRHSAPTIPSMPPMEQLLPPKEQEEGKQKAKKKPPGKQAPKKTQSNKKPKRGPTKKPAKKPTGSSQPVLEGVDIRGWCATISIRSPEYPGLV
jgi:hypothetical protein